MKVQIKTRWIIIAVLLLCGALFTWGYLNGHKRGESASNTQLSALKGQISKYELELNDKTTYISQVEQEILTLREAKKAGDITAKELRVLNLKQVNEINKLTLKIDTLIKNVMHTGRIDTVYINDMPYNAIILPFTFTKTDKWLTLDGSFNKVGILDISLKLNFDADLITGVGKDKKPTALLKTTCPYIGTVTFESIKLDTPKDKKFNISLSGVWDNKVRS